MLFHLIGSHRSCGCPYESSDAALHKGDDEQYPQRRGNSNQGPANHAGEQADECHALFAVFLHQTFDQSSLYKSCRHPCCYHEQAQRQRQAVEFILDEYTCHTVDAVEAEIEESNDQKEDSQTGFSHHLRNGCKWIEIVQTQPRLGATFDGQRLRQEEIYQRSADQEDNSCCKHRRVEIPLAEHAT